MSLTTMKPESLLEKIKAKFKSLMDSSTQEKDKDFNNIDPNEDLTSIDMETQTQEQVDLQFITDELEIKQVETSGSQEKKYRFWEEDDSER